MREIKFRVWDKVLKYFLPYGNYIAMDGKVWEKAKNTYNTPNTEIERVSNIILMQYTGLLDKHRKEIWEGDIIRWSKRPLRTQTISWDLIEGRDYDFCGVGFVLWDESDKCEIIGNIYEHPDLINS